MLTIHLSRVFCLLSSCLCFVDLSVCDLPSRACFDGRITCGGKMRRFQLFLICKHNVVAARATSVSAFIATKYTNSMKSGVVRSLWTGALIPIKCSVSLPRHSHSLPQSYLRLVPSSSTTYPCWSGILACAWYQHS